MKFKPKFIDFELFFILFKFKKGRSIFDVLAKICPKFWHFVGEFGIVLGFGLLGSLYLLKNKISLKKCIFYQTLHTLISVFLIVFIAHAFSIHMFIISSILGTSFLMICLIFEKAISIIVDYLKGSSYVSPGVAPILPKALGIKLKNVPSYLQIPLYALISLVVIIIIHEAFHGILCRLEKIKLKSYGLLFLGLIPMGAFVEPDEEDLNKKKSLQKNKMYAAGSMGNFILFLIVFIAWMGLGNLLHYQGIEFKAYYNVTQTYKNISEIVPGTIIYQISYNQNQNILGLNTSNGYIALKNMSLNEFFSYVDTNVVVFPQNMYWLFVLLDILKYTWLLSLMVGLLNYMPLLIFDGARMLEEISSTLFKNKRFVLYLNLFVLILFLINALPLFI
jgi:membrane-associated protease RseP (regulator of RpoE activity)